MSDPTDHGTTPETPAPALSPEPRRARWSRAVRSRRAMAAGAVVAGLAIGGAGFGAGYAVADGGTTDTATTRTTQDDQGGWGDRQMPGGGPGQMGEMGEVPGGGPMGGLPGGTTQDDGGTTGQLPDYDGDGQPDTDDGSDGTVPRACAGVDQVGRAGEDPRR